MDDYVWWAARLGALSAFSLPLGSALGLVWQPRPKVTGALMAFGSGALMAALALELVAPTATAARPAGAGPSVDLILLLVGGAVGGALFVILDQIINARGGFLRKTATTIAFLSTKRSKRHQEILRRLSAVQVLHGVPPEHVQRLVEMVRPRQFHHGEALFDEGDVGDCLYFIESGAIDLSQRDQVFKTLPAGEIVGEIALLTGAPRTAGARASGHVTTLMLDRYDFERLRELSPELAEATAQLASERLDELASHRQEKAQAAADWAHRAVAALRTSTELPTTADLQQARREHSGAPLAIWLGVLLDGIPESIVIGATLAGALAGALASGPVSFLDIVPYTLIGGLFISNIPEAMSSSIGMRAQGVASWKVLLMWSALVVVTAVGAAIGFWLGDSASHGFVAGMEGIAAGAMLTMIASAMLPEAIHLGGPNVTGVGTLAGFLSAVAFKLVE